MKLTPNISKIKTMDEVDEGNAHNLEILLLSLKHRMEKIKGHLKKGDQTQAYEATKHLIKSRLKSLQLDSERLQEPKKMIFPNLSSTKNLVGSVESLEMFAKYNEHDSEGLI